MLTIPSIIWAFISYVLLTRVANSVDLRYFYKKMLGVVKTGEAAG